MISLATTSSSLGLSSLLSLTINSRYKMLKSLVSSILLPYMIEDVVKYKSTKIAKLAKIMKCVQKDEAETLSEEELCKAFIDSVRERIAKANLPTRLKDLNLTIEQLSLAVEDVKEIDFANTLPRSMSTDDIFDFIKLAY
jgi:alcohol dehydrogenase class IV